jgi:hypothetical protein
MAIVPCYQIDSTLITPRQGPSEYSRPDKSTSKRPGPDGSAHGADQVRPRPGRDGPVNRRSADFQIGTGATILAERAATTIETGKRFVARIVAWLTGG